MQIGKEFKVLRSTFQYKVRR